MYMNNIETKQVIYILFYYYFYCVLFSMHTVQCKFMYILLYMYMYMYSITLIKDPPRRGHNRNNNKIEYK